MCKFRGFVSETTTYASVLTVVTFSIERYVAICHPFHNCVLSSSKRAILSIVGIWMVSMISAIPLTKANVVEPLIYYPPDSQNFSAYSRVCYVSNEKDLHSYLAGISVMFFFIPMIILAATYSKIALSIRSRTLTAAESLQGRVNSTTRSEQDKTAMKVLVAVVISFFICWAPFHIQRLTNHNSSDELKGYLYVFTGVFYYLSATINPILYNVMSRRYRSAFKETITGLKSSTTKTTKTNKNLNQNEFSKTSSTKST